MIITEFRNFSVDLNAAENLHPELRMKAEPRRLPGFLDCGGGLIGRMQIEASEKRRGSKKKSWILLWEEPATPSLGESGARRVLRGV